MKGKDDDRFKIFKRKSRNRKAEHQKQISGSQTPSGR